MNRDFNLPDLGEGLEEAEVIAWRVSPGDSVAADQPFVEVETAKATVEIPSPFAGVVVALHANEGDVVPVGTALITIADDAPSDGPAASEPAAPSEAGSAPDAVADAAPAADADGAGPAQEDASGAVLVGYGTSAHRTPPRPRAAPLSPLLPPPPAEPSRPAVARTPAQSAPSRPATPPMRAMAKRLEVDLATVGDGKTITREQILQAAADRGSEPADERIIPMRGIRRAIAEKVTRSRRDIPEATAWVEADVTDLWTMMREMSDVVGQRIRFLPVLCRAVVSALGTFPVMNSRLSTDGSQIELLPSVHLGIATSTERGLTVPVVRDAQRHSILSLSDALIALAERARADALSPADLTGGTFTVNNYGVLGVDAGDPIINAPEVAILGVGRAIPRPWVVDDQLAIRRTVQLVIAADHRVVDGREAGGLLRRVADLLETPALLWSSL